MDCDLFIQKYMLPCARRHCFYHFTDRRNIESIDKLGLLSMVELKKRGISVPAPGGDEESQTSDKINGTDQYVCLSFTDNHPMAYIARERRSLELINISIHPDVIKIAGTAITLEASNRKGVIKLPLADALDKMDLDVLYRESGWDDQIRERLNVARKYELLVPMHVPRKFLTIPNG